MKEFSLWCGEGGIEHTVEQSKWWIHWPCYDPTTDDDPAWCVRGSWRWQDIKDLLCSPDTLERPKLWLWHHWPILHKWEDWEASFLWRVYDFMHQFHQFNFKVVAVVCDGASTNLTSYYVTEKGHMVVIPPRKMTHTKYQCHSKIRTVVRVSYYLSISPGTRHENLVGLSQSQT